jgi:hypothetical protein
MQRHKAIVTNKYTRDETLKQVNSFFRLYCNHYLQFLSIIFFAVSTPNSNASFQSEHA